ncbi:uncharacterized protein V2V93DRAFT_362691 [Kockiozyma suomiensis]|uniref:uncharacterized protein n=1 Tax=Kockiozyma suomiensis TaxID=1337062 RepID=UPI00334316C3
MMRASLLILILINVLSFILIFILIFSFIPINFYSYSYLIPCLIRIYLCIYAVCKCRRNI